MKYTQNIFLIAVVMFVISDNVLAQDTGPKSDLELDPAVPFSDIAGELPLGLKFDLPPSEGLQNFDLDHYDFWKRIQLQAVAVSNPSRLKDFEVVNVASMTLDDPEQLRIALQRTNARDVRIGYFTNDGSFEGIGVVDSYCANVINDPAIGFACSNEPELLEVLVAGYKAQIRDDSTTIPEQAPDQDIKLVWPSNDNSDDGFQQFLLSHEK